MSRRGLIVAAAAAAAVVVVVEVVGRVVSCPRPHAAPKPEVGARTHRPPGSAHAER